jgi:MFS family permease
VAVGGASAAAGGAVDAGGAGEVELAPLAVSDKAPLIAPAAAAGGGGGAAASPLPAGAQLLPAAAGDGGGAPSWLAITTHPAVIAIAVAHTAHNWQWYFLLTWMPEFMHSQLGFDFKGAGLVAALPYLACTATSVCAGYIADRIIAGGRGKLAVRKAAQTIGELVPGVLLLLCGYVRDRTTVVALLTVAVGANGIANAGYGSNHLDIAPHIAGILLGISNTLATIPGIVAPIIVGDLVAAPHDDAAHWRLAFAIAAAVAAAGFAVFAVFGRAEPLPELAFGPSDADRADAATADGARAALLAPEGEASINY